MVAFPACLSHMKPLLSPARSTRRRAYQRAYDSQMLVSYDHIFHASSLDTLDSPRRATTFIDHEADCSFTMLSGPPRIVPLVFLVLILGLGWWYHQVPSAGSVMPAWRPGTGAHSTQSYRGDPLDFSIPLRFQEGQPKPPGSNYTFKIVIPKTEKEDISWMAQEIPNAPLVVYEVDNPKAENKVPKNKGREAMVRTGPAATGHSRANQDARSILPTSSTTTTTSPTPPSLCTRIATHGTTTSSWASTPPRL